MSDPDGSVTVPTTVLQSIIDQRFVPQDDASKRTIITNLVYVLAGLAALSIIGTVVLVAMAKDVTAVAPFVTLIVGGLIGLFAPSPAGG